MEAWVSPDVKLLRIEDGFLRSVGLGVDLVKPMSWVIDKRGMHYNATSPSDLEYILSTGVWSKEELRRASRLRERIVDLGLTKYNTGKYSWQRPVERQLVILVPGQVESDASLAYGAPGICTNMELLQAVRLANPQAYLVYKPHPDVLAGMRLGKEGLEEALHWCNEVVTDVAMGDLLQLVDQVHVLTSLAGFEALIRDKKVVCYGQPFYSGWGLTFDINANARRNRKLSLDELVAGALIEYPLYMSRDGVGLITPEKALDELVAWRTVVGGGLPWWRKYFRMMLRWIVGVR